MCDCGPSMGEYELMRIEMDEMFHTPHPRDQMRIWQTQEGERISYSDLTDDHLKNIIMYLKRHRTPARQSFPNLWGEYGRRRAMGLIP